MEILFTVVVEPPSQAEYALVSPPCRAGIDIWSVRLGVETQR